MTATPSVVKALEFSTHFAPIDIERAFVEALVQLPAARAAFECRTVAAADFENPQLRSVYSTIASLASRGVSPEPAAIIAESRRTGSVAGSHRIEQLTRLMTDLITAGTAPAMVDFYRRAVLETALRRRVIEAGVRISQAADECSAADMLTMAAAEYTAICEVAQRWKSVPAQQLEATG